MQVGRDILRFLEGRNERTESLKGQLRELRVQPSHQGLPVLLYEVLRGRCPVWQDDIIQHLSRLKLTEVVA